MASVAFTARGDSVGEERDVGSSVRISVGSQQQNLLAPPPAMHSTPGSFSLPPPTKSTGCPLLFERATKSWWDPRFDSNILEDQYYRSTFPLTCQRFQYALLYVFLASVCYCIYFASMARPNWIVFVAATFVLMCSTVVILLFTYTPYYQSYILPTSLVMTLVLCALSLCAFYSFADKDVEPDISSVGLFSICIIVLLLIYTVIPLPLYVCILIGSIYSITFEVLSAILSLEHWPSLIIAKLLLHLCIHMIGIHILLMAEVRMRNTFMKVGQSLMVRRDLEVERQLKEKMIHSIMPPKVADWLMTTQESEDEGVVYGDRDRRISVSPRQSQMIFRPFNMHRMEDVSILFADIVGFTKMSSNKTAEQLVSLLNDLFGRFDYLCNKLGCEKISTLGDCYYCVSGCPEPRSDHARCCVEMGLGMIKAIGEFDEDTNEDVNMRVGVHTGTVLCGIVGTCRFKFDVWSNDVKFANLMESTGKPGRVHISEATYSFLKDQYNVEEGQPQNGVKTYFIKGRKPGLYNRIMSSSKTSSNRHSWPLHIPQFSEASSRTESRKPSSQSERERYQDDGATVPMLPVIRHSSLVTLSSSRKDSGIRSRHSSLQDVMFDTPASFLIQRMGGYYASSQLSMADTGRSSGSSVRGCNMLVDPALSLNESLARLRHIRKQSDLQLIRCVQQDSEHVDYFVRPPINQISLFFLDSLMEYDYRRHLHSRGVKESAAFTLASPAFISYFDIAVSAIFYMVIATVCFMLFQVTVAWLVFCLLATGFQLYVILVWVYELFSLPRPAASRRWPSRVYSALTKWYPWHVCGAVLVGMPVISVFTNFSCYNVMRDSIQMNAFCYLALSTIVHFCNFTELNLWVKCVLATLSGTTLIVILGAPICTCRPDVLPPDSGFNYTALVLSEDQYVADVIYNMCGFPLVYEIILDVLLISILVWFLNREFEISYRLSFHGSVTAARDKRKIQMMKNQADWLLHNIIPKHVAEILKSTSKYSENHKDAGIIFASIVNFHELYDESFEGGKECLRVLNELVGDFDELLRKPEFRNIEKIKTIGSTFMAASGLNPQLRAENPHEYTHLYELMDFALSMMQVIERFNYNLLEFSFVMRIGYNFGDVTAGVIGTTKLYYDIWGDAVNIASRMDSHGIPGHIQVPEHCLSVLEKAFDFKYRGSVYIKGKNNMSVYLVVGRKGANQCSKEAKDNRVGESQGKAVSTQNGR